ncbi:hypothetical protein [Clostridium sp. Marseille-P299]|uniref:hypothetical protein n=1 Tax=Clostridium sp. Marseille-P299 TaxID=1805477 RepID=UPI00082AE5D4|nr:hypothetical protein [Clostridium sp. Marseille-P299]
MDPFSFDSDDNFSSRVYPVVTFTNYSIDDYIETLDSSTKEAIARNRDQFQTRADVERFVKGLRG